MMTGEFEVVSQGTFRYLHVFLVQMGSRTPHIHKEIELGLVLSGNLTVREGKRAWRIGANELYLINSMEPHEFVSENSDTVILAVQVSPQLLVPFVPEAAMVRYQIDPPVTEQLGDDSRKVRCLCLSLLKLCCLRPNGYRLACFAEIGEMMHLLDKLPKLSLEPKHYDAVRRRMDRMAEITDYIDQNFQRKLLLEEIAERQGLTLTYTSHLFKDTLGITFQEYLKERRFEHAVSLIENTERTILDITVESGFSDERYLCSLFRDRMGCSPREYRKRRGMQENALDAHGSVQHIFFPEEALTWLEQWERMQKLDGKNQ